ncbi:MAG: DUF1192 domain-containing protein [Hyphomicrobiales bacterium]|nr:DUF1192 domain-containing protein [Hyphomicrobiales bacterium]MBV8768642.1 DUF1192 domain-containing protein [Hyphomicrobiales bacterium]MBV9054060.1 DUF1192 domain-containing protein [Hyphomicrobiales bacterium]MBV9138637.1 DUF1192 domain-containing protein [Hyphomicrobiales bacterium]MBV9588650.1 DUF1192 domain-containing protein [Hyphomicrobiales bacterium]
MDNDEPRPKRPRPAHEIGQDLSTLSIIELDERVAVLRNEIMRLETAKNQKLAAQGSANSFFKR